MRLVQNVVVPSLLLAQGISAFSETYKCDKSLESTMTCCKEAAMQDSKNYAFNRVCKCKVQEAVEGFKACCEARGEKARRMYTPKDFLKTIQELGASFKALGSTFKNVLKSIW